MLEWQAAGEAAVTGADHTAGKAWVGCEGLGGIRLHSPVSSHAHTCCPSSMLSPAGAALKYSLLYGEQAPACWCGVPAVALPCPAQAVFDTPAGPGGGGGGVRGYTLPPSPPGRGRPRPPFRVYYVRDEGGAMLGTQLCHSVPRRPVVLTHPATQYLVQSYLLILLLSTSYSPTYSSCPSSTPPHVRAEEAARARGFPGRGEGRGAGLVPVTWGHVESGELSTLQHSYTSRCSMRGRDTSRRGVAIHMQPLTAIHRLT